MALCLGAGQATAAGTGSFVRHQDPYWVWFGPSDFLSSSGAYGITIYGPQRDSATIDYGGSSVFCDGPPDQHFATQRASFAATPGLKKVRQRKVSAITQSGLTYSQAFKFSAKANGKKIGGSLGMQYSSYDGTYCYQATLYKAAIDNKRFKQSLKTLDAIWDRTAYSGPGLPIDPNTGLP